MSENKEVAKTSQNPIKKLESDIALAKNVKELLKINVISNRYIANYQAGTGRKDGAEKFEREAFAFMEIANSKPEIMNCDKMSIFAGFIKAGLTGLSFSSNRLSVYARGGKLVVEPDAHGKREMMERMPTIRKIDEAVVVFKGDVFKVDRHAKRVTKHEQEFPTPKATKENVIAAYCTIHFTDDSFEDVVMSIDQIEIARAKSQQPNGMMWGGSYEEACKKTTYNRAHKIHYKVPETAVLFKQYEPEETTDSSYQEVADETQLSEVVNEEVKKEEVKKESNDLHQDAEIVHEEEKKPAPAKKKRGDIDL